MNAVIINKDNFSEDVLTNEPMLRKPDIEEGLKEYQSVEGAVLLDVRTPKEYSDGHIPERKMCL